MTAAPRPGQQHAPFEPNPRRRALSIQWNLALFGIAVVAPMVLVTGVLQIIQASASREQSRQEARQIARNIADDISRDLDATISVLQALAFAPILQDAKFAAFDGLARKISGLRGTDIIVRDLSGRQLVNTGIPLTTPLPAGYDKELRRADRIVLEAGKPVVSDLFADDTGQHVSIVVPVLRDNIPIYFLSARIAPERIVRVLKARDLPPRVITGLVDSNLRMLARSVDAEKFLGSEASRSFHESAVRPEGEWQGKNRVGEQISGFFVTLDLVNWRVGVSMPTELLAEPFRRSLVRVLALGALGLAVSLVLAVLLGRKMSGPIRAMATGAAALTRGDLIAPVSSGVRELNQLSALISGASHDLRREAFERDRAEELLRQSADRIRAMSEEALRRSQEHYRQLIDSVKDYAILMLDPNGIVTTWNDGAERINGYTAEEAIGHSFLAFFPPDAIANGDPQRELGIAAAEGRLENAGWRVRKNGERYWAEVAIAPIYGDDGSHAGFSKIIRDVSMRQRQEQALQEKNAELELAVKELDAFSYSVSHDLRAPLRAVDGFSRILLNDYGDQLDENGCDFLRRVLDNAVRMGDLIDDLLKFSQLSRQPLSKRRVTTTSVVERVVADEHIAAGERTVEVIVGDLPDMVGDAGLLKQVFVNLIGNAFKYTSKREQAVIDVGSRRIDDETAYFVRDNGAGFDMQYAGKLFGVFMRLHRAEDFAGTGVGLAIVKRIVERHGGRVWADAEVGKGATFYFTLGKRAA